jgi:serine/threonine protein kinase
MATVYSAYDAQLGRVIAIKVLSPHVDTAGVRSRLLREAQAMARLRHPNVITVYDVGTLDDQVFIAMEYVDGTTLRPWLKGRSVRERLDVLKAAGRGLAAAHQAGLVHRDFKPDNVLLGKDGRVLVSDFGIARADPGASDAAEETPGSTPAPSPARPGARASPLKTSTWKDPLTEEGAILGTVGYIAPEHLFQDVNDERSDQFSFCVTMYVALYGKYPFCSSDISTYSEALLADPQPPPSHSGVPGWIHAILARGLRRDPGERFATMGELLAALERDPSRRRRIGVLGAVLAAACLVTVAGYAHHRVHLRARCAEGEAIMRASLGTAAREQVRRALEGAGGTFGPELARRVDARLADYAASWAALHDVGKASW